MEGALEPLACQIRTNEVFDRSTAAAGGFEVDSDFRPLEYAPAHRYVAYFSAGFAADRAAVAMEERAICECNRGHATTPPMAEWSSASLLGCWAVTMWLGTEKLAAHDITPPPRLH